MTDNQKTKDEILAEFPRRLSRSLTFLQRQRKKFMSERLKPYGFVGTMYMILLHIGRHPGTTQDAIVSHMFIDKCNVARRTKKLEELGYIRREVDSNDRRQYNLYLTEKGEQILPVIRGYIVEWSGYLTENMSEEECRNALALLTKMAENGAKHF